MDNTQENSITIHLMTSEDVEIIIKVPDGSGVWYKDSPLEPYDDCQNDDDLVLYLQKNLHTV